MAHVIERAELYIHASFSHRLLLPKAENLVVSYTGSDGKPKLIYFDLNYSTSFALTHPDFENNAYRVGGSEFQDPKIHLYVIAPVDPALSKASRCEENDREDIAELTRHNLIDLTVLVDRAEVAIEYYIGDPSIIRLNLKEAVEIVRAAKTEPKGAAGG